MDSSVVPCARLERARVGILRIDVMAMDDTSAGADGIAEQEFSEAIPVAGKLPPGGLIVDRVLWHHVSQW